MGYNKITLYGEQLCDYLYVQNTGETNNFGKVDFKPTWSSETLLFSDFEGNLKAGNSSLSRSLDGYIIRRRRGADSNLEYITTINNDYANYHVIDYMVANNTDYTYYMYPFWSKDTDNTMLPPFVTHQVTPKWDYWCLMVVDESSEENVFYLNKMFKFELNLSVGEMNNNATTKVIPNFTRYPIVQKNTTNYWSGSLTSLCGFLTCNDEYVQSPDMINEFKELSSDTRKKFLKDNLGNVWEIEITSPISIATDDTSLEQVKTIEISWAEVGDATKYSVINKPGVSAVSWILTRTGAPNPYTSYEWSRDSIWDNNKFWTSNNGVLDVDIFSMGREMQKKEESV